VQPQHFLVVVDKTLDRERRHEIGSAVMKSLFFVAAFVCVASLAACSFKEERVVQPAPAPTVVTPAPAGSVVYTQPAPATTTVYTTR
jgi:hypothetical protein